MIRTLNVAGEHVKTDVEIRSGTVLEFMKSLYGDAEGLDSFYGVPKVSIAA